MEAEKITRRRIGELPRGTYLKVYSSRGEGVCGEIQGPAKENQKNNPSVIIYSTNPDGIRERKSVAANSTNYRLD